MSVSDLINSYCEAARSITADTIESTLPPEDGMTAVGQRVLSRSIVARTRNYIERVVEQANESYERGCYDASAVMIRRLIETLIIECFEAKSLASVIKDANGNYLMLSDLIDRMISQDSKNHIWNLSRNTKTAMRPLKELGDLSAHNRRFNCRRSDIDKNLSDLRIVVEELVSLANLQRHK